MYWEEHGPRYFIARPARGVIMVVSQPLGAPTDKWLALMNAEHAAPPYESCTVSTPAAGKAWCEQRYSRLPRG
jgi:hypothetical protein